MANILKIKQNPLQCLMKKLTGPICPILFSVLLSGCNPENPVFEKKTWSIEMANAVISRFDSLIYYNNPTKVKWQYDIAMVGQAIDKLGYIDQKYSAYMEGFYNYFLQEDGSIRLYNKEDYNLDHVNPAKGLITLYKRTGEEKYIKAIEHIVGQLMEQPKTTAGGFWHKKIYPHQMWLDGIYMATPFLAQYAREFDQPQWYEEAADQITLAYIKTVDPGSGLLYHAHDACRIQKWCDPKTGQSGEFWGRAMGWYMMALVDVLDYFPDNHPRRGEIMDILNKTSEALLKVRDVETGLWYQVLNKGNQKGNYLEASCSNMFIYAFAKGAQKGYLPKKYLKIAQQSFESAVNEFIAIDEKGMPVLKKTCGAAGLGGNPYRDGSYEYYVNEKIVDNDPKGVGPFILAAIQLEY